MRELFGNITNLLEKQVWLSSIRAVTFGAKIAMNEHSMIALQMIENYSSPSFQFGSKGSVASDRQRIFQAEACKIFRNYALSPADFSEAVLRFTRLRNDSMSLPVDQELSSDDLVRRVLYSMQCEDVWRRR